MPPELFSETSPNLKDLYCKPISHPTLIFSVESMLCRTTHHSHQHSQNIYTVTPFALLQMAPERLVASCMKLCCGKCLSISLSSYTCVSRDALDPQKKTTKISGTSETRSETPHGHSYVFLTVQPISFSRFEVIPLCTTHRDLRRRNYPATALTAWNRSQRNHKRQIWDLRWGKKNLSGEYSQLLICFKSTSPAQKKRKETKNQCVWFLLVSFPSPNFCN